MIALFALSLPDDFLGDVWAVVKRVSVLRIAGLMVIGAVVEAGVLYSGCVVDPSKIDETMGFPARYVRMVSGLAAIAIYGAALWGRFGSVRNGTVFSDGSKLMVPGVPSRPADYRQPASQPVGRGFPGNPAVTEKVSFLPPRSNRLGTPKMLLVAIVP